MDQNDNESMIPSFPDGPRGITVAKFYSEAMTFRKIMQDGRNTISAIQRAFGILFQVLNRVDINDPKMGQAESNFQALAEEWSRRQGHMMMAGHPYGDPDNIGRVYLEGQP
jgi:hypothetical protein